MTHVTTDNIALTDLAGLLGESHVWQLMSDMASALSGDAAAGLSMMPSNICWNGEAFVIDSSHERSSAYLPPEGADAPDAVSAAVWSLGATAFHAYMGCDVFNGRGGRAQLPSSPLPILRKSMPELSALISACLEYDPKRRPSPADIKARAAEMLGRPVPKRSLRKNAGKANTATKTSADFWPDEMI